MKMWEYGNIAIDTFILLYFHIFIFSLPDSGDLSSAEPAPPVLKAVEEDLWPYPLYNGLVTLRAIHVA